MRQTMIGAILALSCIVGCGPGPGSSSTETLGTGTNPGGTTTGGTTTGGTTTGGTTTGGTTTGGTTTGGTTTGGTTTGGTTTGGTTTGGTTTGGTTTGGTTTGGTMAGGTTTGGTTTGGTTTGGTTTGGTMAGGTTTGGTTSACLASAMSNWAGQSRLLDGADLDSTSDSKVHINIRAQYLSGGYPTQGVCSSCASNCSGGDWWGCWQDSSVAPGQFVRSFATNARAKGELPYFTYYEILQASGASEGSGEVQIANNATFMKRYFDDYRFFLQQLGGRAMIHLEPDFWGYAEQVNENPHNIAAAVASANPTDCSGQENSIAGMGHCMVAMARKYAPDARIGLHGSGWATKIDVLPNTDPSLDVAAEGRKLAAFLGAAGEDQADFVAIDASDRDAGYYALQGSKTSFWDPTNTTLPDFHQAFAWATALSSALGKPAVWWQLPYGNMSLPNTRNAYQDNRLDYFFNHPGELVAANTFAFVFGAGQSDQTNASSDGGHFIAMANAYAGQGPAICP